LCEKVFVAPGNAGTADEPKTENIDLNAEDLESLLAFAKNKEIDLTIVGPEAPLVLGLIDLFEKNNLLCLGPNKLAAQMEGSKIFMKDVLKKGNIPTATYEVFTDPESAREFLETCDIPIVLKADGLAAGKGVIVAFSRDEALEALNSLMVEQKLGTAGDNLVIEEFLKGEEASFIVLCDGKNVISLASSQDHKQRDDGDKGPNTGGMGAYSPAPLITEEINEVIMKDIIHPTLAELKRRNIDYKGFLYAGLMINEQKIKVLEYNCRFGDPETQPILMRMKSDFLSLCLKAAKQELKGVQIDWDDRFALGVVMASKGYPEKYETGFPISGLNGENETTKVFHCGTKIEGEKILSNGGRVLCVTGLGGNLDTAFKNAYETTSKISWDGAFYRKDIGKRNQ
jgi:phosphoribosylamine--glycine ligase